MTGWHTSRGSPASGYAEHVDDDVFGRQTDWSHVAVERLRLVQLQQRQVAVARLLVIAIVYDDFYDGRLSLSAFRLCLVVVAQHHAELMCPTSTLTSAMCTTH